MHNIKSLVIVVLFGISLFILAYTVSTMMAASKQLANRYANNTQAIMHMNGFNAVSTL